MERISNYTYDIEFEIPNSFEIWSILILSFEEYQK